MICFGIGSNQSLEWLFDTLATMPQTHMTPPPTPPNPIISISYIPLACLSNCSYSLLIVCYMNVRLEIVVVLIIHHIQTRDRMCCRYIHVMVYVSKVVMCTWLICDLYLCYLWTVRLVIFQCRCPGWWTYMPCSDITLFYTMVTIALCGSVYCLQTVGSSLRCKILCSNSLSNIHVYMCGAIG